MTRFTRAPSPYILPATALSVVAVFVLDFNTQLGVAAWVFYFIPVVISYLAWHPRLPVLVAFIATVMTLVGYFMSAPGMDQATARVNRSFGIVTLWVLAAIGHQYIENKVAVRLHEWLQTGQMRLSAAMVGDPTIATLGKKILTFLGSYLEAQAGTLFVREGMQYGRVASYGVPETVALPDRIGSDDGLMGQAAAERRMLVVPNVPETHLVAGSSLAKGPPRHLLIAPIILDDQVIALLELGFFDQVKESDRELITRVSESVGVAVRSAHYRTRLQELLEESQRQAEELQVQSEELRVSNEELEEQGRALRDSQARLEEQHAELEQTNQQLEEQARLLELQKAELTTGKMQLEAQSRELERASRYKSEFLANMSHELRTPLNAALILARQLADNRRGNLSPDQVKHAKTIESAGQDLLLLINDVLDLAKVEAGHLAVHPQPVELGRLAHQLRDQFLPLTDKKGLRLSLRVSDMPSTIVTDPQRLEQVLKNLLSNAIKFTEQGEVTLEIKRHSQNRVMLAVQDTGIGIPEDKLEVIFEPFCQADGTTSRRYGGTGLGLSISRQLVQLLGGQIQLSSRVGVGSTFSIILPEVYQSSEPRASSQAAAPEAAPVRQPAAPRRPRSASLDDDRERLKAGRRTILIVEDDERFARVLIELAHRHDFQALVAMTSSEALSLASEYSPNAVVLDIGLPDHSGLAVLDRLKSDIQTRHIPVHVISAYDYMQAALSLGAVGYLMKPVQSEQLEEAFARLESRLTQKVRRVLIVEDHPAQRLAVAQLLASNDVKTVEAASMAECLEKLQRDTFDCMILDVELPDGTAFSLLDRLSRENRYAFPPIIVYTGRELSLEEEEHLRRYAQSVIIKGAKSPERLLDEVTLFLHQVISTLPAEQRAMLEQARHRDTVLEGRRILLAEDDVRNVFALTSLFEPTGAQLVVARNGREALEALERSIQPGGQPIHLVLMDVMMPEMDGHRAMREIRKRAEWAKLPIIAITAKATKQDQEEALEAGANDYMAKPLDVDKLLSLVRVWIPR